MRIISNYWNISLFLGYSDCLNDEDCLGADRLCFRNASMKVGKCNCREGFKPAKEDPIKCLNIELNECHTNLDCPRHYPCVKHIPLLHAVNRVVDDQFYVSMKKECFAAFDPTLGGNLQLILCQRSQQ